MSGGLLWLTGGQKALILKLHTAGGENVRYQ